MEVIGTDLPEVRVLIPRVFADDRGWFFESFNERDFADAVDAAPSFVQDNQSRSMRGVLRGLHYQMPPMAQGKLVRVIAGAIFDVAVDIRRSSPTYKSWVGVELTADNHQQLWVPAGFAHAFLVLSDSADVLYKTTEYYSSEHERSIRWDDPDIAIDWPDIGMDPILSHKDHEAPWLRDADTFE